MGKDALASAKIVSLVCLLPLVVLYTRLIERYSRETMLYILPAMYGVLMLLFSAGIYSVYAFDATNVANACRAAGTIQTAPWLNTLFAYGFYVLVESYGSLVVALFWAFLSEITLPDSAKKGFPFVVALGQIGSIFGPVVIARIPGWLGHATIAPAVFIASLLTFAIIPAFRNFLKVTPKHLTTTYGGATEKQRTETPGFFEGLILLVKHWYLLGILLSVFAFEFIATIIDFNFHGEAFTQFGNTPAYHSYLGDYGGYVNAATLLCLLLGVSNITRILGISVTLACVPLILGSALFGFLAFKSLNVLLWLMVGANAINYALNGPALKQLYIPTTHDTKFKAQAWIETFGSRGSKSGASVLNLFKAAGPAYYLILCNYIGFSLVIVWFFVALYLGRTHHRAIKSNKIVC